MPILAARVYAVSGKWPARSHTPVFPNDSQGHNDVGWVNSRTITPHLDALAKGGMELTQWYVFKYCAPTRGMISTGRYPFHYGFYANKDSNTCALRHSAPIPHG
eukprot:COSAG01_NODE_3604_length_5881_cov_6.368558_2_plen_104_part_00